MDVGDMMDASFRAYRARMLTFLTIAVVAYMPFAMVMSIWQSFIQPDLDQWAQMQGQLVSPPQSATEPLLGPDEAEPLGQSPDATLEAAEESAGEGAQPSGLAAVAKQWGGAAFSPVGADMLRLGLGELPLFAQTGGRPDVAAELRASGMLMLGGIFTLLFLTVVEPLAKAALLFNISALYLGREMSAAESYRLALPRLPTLIGANFLVWLAIMAGYCMMVVPGVLVQVWMMVLAPAILLEKRTAVDAIYRSFNLVSGNLSRSFLLGGAAFVLTMLGALLVQGFVGLLPIESEAAGVFLVNLGNAAVLPLTVGPGIFLYYDLRIRKEGMDLTMLGEAIA